MSTQNSDQHTAPPSSDDDPVTVISPDAPELVAEDQDEDEDQGHTLANGYQLQEYVIEKVLGVGGFGVTYLANDTHLHTLVAIKEYLPSSIAIRGSDVSVSPKSRSDKDLYKWGLESFLLEARTLASFKHPSIVKVLRFFEQNHTAYMVMEYEKGQSLREYVQHNGPPEEAELIAMFKPLLEGLAEVHAKNFLHRDIKPANIIVRENKSLVLLDFGAARQKVDEKSEDNGMTTIVTPGYAPLEQYHRHGNQGPWSDIYALGAVLYWVVSGFVPVVAPARMKDDPLVPLETACKGRYSQELLKAVDWALRVDEEDRPQSIPVLLSYLVEGATMVLDEKQELAYAKKSSKRSSRAKTVALWLGGLLVVGGIAFGAYSYWQLYQQQLILVGPKQVVNPDAMEKITEIKPVPGKMTWERTIGGANDDKLISMEELPGGGGIAVGNTISMGEGGEDILAIKVDGFGRTVWQRTYGGSGNDVPYDIKVAKDGSGFLVSGGTTSKGNGGIDVWVFKLDNDGNMVWEQTFGGSYDDVPGDIAALTPGGDKFLVVAYTQSKGAGSEDIWFFEADKDGNIAWEKTFGGPMSDIPDDLKILGDDGFLMTGWQDSKGAGGYDAWMLRMDKDGNKLWGRTYGEDGDDIIETMHVVDSGYLLAGRTDSKGVGGTDAWLMKVDKLGNIIWEKTYGGPKDDDFRDIENAPDGTYLIAGVTKSFGARGGGDVLVMNINDNGEIIWSRTFGGDGLDEISDFEASAEKDGGYLFAGSTRSKGEGGFDGWLFRMEFKDREGVGDY